MSSKKVVAAGNCMADHGSLSRLLSSQFQAELTGVDTAEELHAAVEKGDVDLVLVNRVFDRNGADGVAIIGDLCQQENAPPVMLISNYADAQQRAEAAGARPGFGKAALTDPATLEKLGAILQS